MNGSLPSLLEGGDVDVCEYGFVVLQAGHFLREVAFIEHFLLAGLPQLEVLTLHPVHLILDAVDLKLHPVHLLMGVLQFVLHLLHLARLLLQRLLVLYQLLVDLGSWLSRQHVLQLQEQLLLVADQVLLCLHLLRLRN